MSVKIEIDGDSEEAVAFALLNMVARAEGKLDVAGGMSGCDREWLLDAYAECLVAVCGDREVEPPETEDDGEEEEEEDQEETSKAA